MKLNRQSSIILSLILIFILTILHPYLVIGSKYGPSSNCIDCSIIEDSFFATLLWLTIPISSIYMISKHLTKRNWLTTILVTIYYFIVSFVSITIPLFRDRIAAWSTFSEEEIWIEGFIMALPSLATVTAFFSIFLFLLNPPSSRL